MCFQRKQVHVHVHVHFNHYFVYIHVQCTCTCTCRLGMDTRKYVRHNIIFLELHVYNTCIYMYMHTCVVMFNVRISCRIHWLGGKSIINDIHAVYTCIYIYIYIHVHVRMWSTLPLGGSGSILPHVRIIIHVGPLGYFWGPRSLVAE